MFKLLIVKALGLQKMVFDGQAAGPAGLGKKMVDCLGKGLVSLICNLK